MSTKTSITTAALALAALVPVTAPVHAAVFCVSDPAAIQQAFTAAAASPDSDEIRLRTGFYAPAAPLSYATQTLGDLTVSGGWQPDGEADCAIQSSAAAETVLDGGHQRQIMRISQGFAAAPASPPRLTVSNLTFQNGAAQDLERGGAFAISSTGFATDVELDRLVVAGNSGQFGGGIDIYVQRGSLRIGNSLFVDNTAVDSPIGHLAITMLDSDAPNAIVIANSTFAFGSCVVQGSRGCGVHAGIGGRVRMDLVNNLFDHNLGSDATIEGQAVIGYGDGSAFLERNRIPFVAGSITPTVIDPLIGDPRFVDVEGRDFRLSDVSPFLDLATAAPIHPLPATDLEGQPRVRFGGLDPGPYENQRWDFIFGSGFDDAD